MAKNKRLTKNQKKLLHYLKKEYETNNNKDSKSD